MGDRLHVEMSQEDPVYVLYADIINQVNAHARAWQMTEGLSEAGRNQAIASAFMTITAHYFRNVWHQPKDHFLGLADEEYDNAGDPTKARKNQ